MDFQNQVNVRRQQFMEARLPKDFGHKETIPQKFQIKIPKSQITQKMEETLADYKFSQKTANIEGKDTFKEQYKCYPCLKQKNYQNDDNKQPEDFEENLEDILQISQKQQFPQQKQNLTPRQQYEKIKNQYQPDNNNNSNILEFGNQNLQDNVDNLLEQKYNNEEQIKQQEKENKSLKHQIQLVIRKFKNNLTQNTLFQIDQKLQVLKQQSQNQDEVFKISKLIKENEKLLKVIEQNTIQDILQEEQEFDQFSQEARIELLNDIQILNSTIEIQETQISEITKKANDYAVQINRLIDKEHDRGLQNTIKRLLELEKLTKNTQDQFSDYMKQIEILKEQNQKLIHENRVLFEENCMDRTKFLNYIGIQDTQELIFEKYLENMERELAETRIKLLDAQEIAESSTEEAFKKGKENQLLRNRLQELQSLTKSQQEKIEKYAQEMSQIENNLKKQYEMQINQYLRDNNLQQITIENLEKQLIDSHSQLQQTQYKQTIEGALKELSMIILSKDNSKILDDHTKLLIKDLFGENFSRIVNNYEEKINNTKKQLENVKENYKDKSYKHNQLQKSALKLCDILLELNMAITISDIPSKINFSNQQLQQSTNINNSNSVISQNIYNKMNKLLYKLQNKIAQKKQGILQLREQIQQEIQNSEQINIQQQQQQYLNKSKDNNNLDSEEEEEDRNYENKEQQQYYYQFSTPQQNKNKNFNNSYCSSSSLESPRQSAQVATPITHQGKVTPKNTGKYSSVSSVEKQQQKKESEIYEQIDQDLQIKNMKIKQLEEEIQSLEENVRHQNIILEQKEEQNLELNNLKQQYDILEKKYEKSKLYDISLFSTNFDQQALDKICYSENQEKKNKYDDYLSCMLMQAISIEELYNLGNNDDNEQEQTNNNNDQSQQNNNKNSSGIQQQQNSSTKIPDTILEEDEEESVQGGNSRQNSLSTHPLNTQNSTEKEQDSKQIYNYNSNNNISNDNNNTIKNKLNDNIIKVNNLSNDEIKYDQIIPISTKNLAIKQEENQQQYQQQYQNNKNNNDDGNLLKNNQVIQNNSEEEDEESKKEVSLQDENQQQQQSINLSASNANNNNVVQNQDIDFEDNQQKLRINLEKINQTILQRESQQSLRQSQQQQNQVDSINNNNLYNINKYSQQNSINYNDSDKNQKKSLELNSNTQQQQKQQSSNLNQYTPVQKLYTYKQVETPVVYENSNQKSKFETYKNDQQIHQNQQLQQHFQPENEQLEYQYQQYEPQNENNNAQNDQNQKRLSLKDQILSKINSKKSYQSSQNFEENNSMRISNELDFSKEQQKNQFYQQNPQQQQKQNYQQQQYDNSNHHEKQQLKTLDGQSEIEICIETSQKDSSQSEDYNQQDYQEQEQNLDDFEDQQSQESQKQHKKKNFNKNNNNNGNLDNEEDDDDNDGQQEDEDNDDEEEEQEDEDDEQNSFDSFDLELIQQRQKQFDKQ